MNTYFRQAMIALALALVVGIITFWLRTYMIQTVKTIDSLNESISRTDKTCTAGVCQK